MSAQPSLIQEANDNEVLLPSNDQQWQLVRDHAEFPDGKYYAYDKDGNKEPIGAPSPQLYVELNYNILTRVCTPTIVGGTADTVANGGYTWTMKSSLQPGNFVPDATFQGATNGATATVAQDPQGNTSIGLVTLKVKDTLGRFASATFLVAPVPVVP